MRRDRQLAAVQASDVGQRDRQALQLVQIRRRLERGGHAVEQLVARHNCRFCFRAGNASLGQLEVGELQALVIRRVADDRHCKTFATRVLQLAQRQLNADIFATLGAGWHFDRRAGVDDQPMPRAQVAFVAHAVNAGDCRGHDDLDRLTFCLLG